MSTVTANKLKTKDIITVVLLALINVVIFFASSVPCTQRPSPSFPMRLPPKRWRIR